MLKTFDAAVIGGGVVGCAVARALTLRGLTVVLIEKEADILAGASKANSAILHTGFDAPPGSLELACMRAGYAEYMDIRERLGLPLLQTGAVVAAWNDAELARLDGIAAKAEANGVTDTRRLSAADVLAREPNLSPALLGGLLIPGEHVIDPWSAPLAYIQQALLNGATIRRDTEVLGGEDDGRIWTLATSAGQIAARHVVNCAGLHGDIIETKLTGASPFRIAPRKGQFVVYDKAAARLLRTIILPVPTERTKGVVLCPTIFGNLLVGPTAEEQEDRDHAAVEHGVLQALKARAAEILPALADMPVTAAYAGLRPATEHQEYQLRHDPARRLFTAGGIRSTGLTGALGIAKHVADALEGVPLPDPLWPAVPMLAEHEARDWTRPGAGEIVCHCELVTRREIEAALAGPLPAGDFGGLRRRTRAGLGRCQGFYCNARLAALTQGRFGAPLAVGAGD